LPKKLTFITAHFIQLGKNHTCLPMSCKKGIVISTSHLLSEFQVSEFNILATCMDSKFCKQIG